MVTIVEVVNPFQPTNGMKTSHTCSGQTVREFLLSRDPAFVEFPRPTICLLNGKPLMRSEWAFARLRDGDVVSFVAVQGGFLAILVIVIVAVAFVVGAMMKVNVPRIPGQIPEPDPVYNITGQKNQMRLGYAIEVAYGRVRLWPSYAAKSYNQYINNDQWQFQLFCLGQGSFSIENVYIEDTQISAYQDVTMAIYQPGESVTLFPDNVVTSVEVSNIELFGPNEASYPSGSSGYVGGFVANSAFTRTTRIEVDVVFPNGLYYSNDSGGLDSRTITGEFQYRALDDAGNPIGGWVLLTNFTKSLATTTPQRFTLSATVASGRYEIRGRRTNNKDTSSRAGNTLTWEVLRAFLPSTKDYGDVTLLAIKARATNNLNDSASNRVNVVATRKLRSWNKLTQSWNAPAATRSIVWAFCDLFTSEYGGRLDDKFLDLDNLYDMDVAYAARSDFFDWIFDQKTTVWEAARTMARAGRAVPILNGSQVTMVRDEPKSVPVAIFSPDNIVEGSFKWEIKLADIDEPDGLELEYLDPTTWKQETLLCTLPGEDGYNPSKVTLAGVTNRTQAYHEGMYIRASERYNRQNVVFKTGYEGFIPSFGDLIAVSHDVPRWGQTGLVLSIDGLIVTLNTPVTFTVGATQQIIFRKKDGSAAGPYTCTEGDSPNKVVLASPLVDTFYFDGIHEPPYFLFGISDKATKLCKVLNIVPSEDEEMEITASVYNPVIYSFDSLPAPVLRGSTAVTIPDLPVVSGFRVDSSPGDATIVLLSWSPALGAQSYLIQQSRDNVNWDNVARVTSSSYTLSVLYGYLYLRVAAINVGQGPWATWEGTVGVTTVSPTTIVGLALTEAFTGTSVSVNWNAMLAAAQYKVRVYQDAGATLKRTITTPANAATYTIANAISDGTPKRSMRIGVVGVNGVGVESPTEAVLDVYNAPPDALTGLASPRQTNTSTEATYLVQYTPSAATDLAGYRIWGSATSGFTPGAGNLLYDGLGTLFLISIPKSGGTHAPYYWRAAAYDVWGTDVFNTSAQQTITYVP